MVRIPPPHPARRPSDNVSPHTLHRPSACMTMPLQVQTPDIHSAPDPPPQKHRHLFQFHGRYEEPTCLRRWNRQYSEIKFRYWGITLKKAYNIQNMAKVWDQEYCHLLCKSLVLPHEKCQPKWKICLWEHNPSYIYKVSVIWRYNALCPEERLHRSTDAGLHTTLPIAASLVCHSIGNILVLPPIR